MLNTEFYELRNWMFGSLNQLLGDIQTNPDYKTPNSLNFIDGLQVTLPEPLVIEKNQRPYMNH